MKCGIPCCDDESLKIKTKHAHTRQKWRVGEIQKYNYKEKRKNETE